MSDLLSAAEVADILEVSGETVRRWVASGRIRHIRLPSGQVRFERADIDAIRQPVEPTEAAS
jgi:excisionase family DNA binding protein